MRASSKTTSKSKHENKTNFPSVYKEKQNKRNSRETISFRYIADEEESDYEDDYNNFDVSDDVFEDGSWLTEPVENEALKPETSNDVTRLEQGESI